MVLGFDSGIRLGVGVGVRAVEIGLGVGVDKRLGLGLELGLGLGLGWEIKGKCSICMHCHDPGSIFSITAKRHGDKAWFQSRAASGFACGSGMGRLGLGLGLEQLV